MIHDEKGFSRLPYNHKRINFEEQRNELLYVLLRGHHQEPRSWWIRTLPPTAQDSSLAHGKWIHASICIISQDLPRKNSLLPPMLMQNLAQLPICHIYPFTHSFTFSHLTNNFQYHLCAKQCSRCYGHCNEKKSLSPYPHEAYILVETTENKQIDTEHKARYRVPWKINKAE